MQVQENSCTCNISPSSRWTSEFKPTKEQKQRAAYPFGGERGGTDGEEGGLGLTGNAFPCQAEWRHNSLPLHQNIASSRGDDKDMHFIQTATHTWPTYRHGIFFSPPKKKTKKKQQQKNRQADWRLAGRVEEGVIAAGNEGWGWRKEQNSSNCILFH